MKKFLEKNQNDFKRSRFATSGILMIHRIIKETSVKNLEATLLFVDFFKIFLYSEEIWNKYNQFLSLRVYGLLSSSLFLFPQRFGRYVLRPSSGVCRTLEPSRNFKLRPLFNPRVSPVLIPFAITGYKC